MILSISIIILAITICINSIALAKRINELELERAGDRMMINALAEDVWGEKE